MFWSSSVRRLRFTKKFEGFSPSKHAKLFLTNKGYLPVVLTLLNNRMSSLRLRFLAVIFCLGHFEFRISDFFLVFLRLGGGFLKQSHVY